MKLNQIFRNGMVLPANREFRIFGESKEIVTIKFLGETKICEPKNGIFSTMFSAKPFGGPYSMVVESLNEKITIDDIYLGILLLMSGQSNMMFKVKEGKDVLDKREDDDLLRLYSCDHIIFFDGELEYFRSSAGWVKCKKEEVDEWSSLVYQVGCELRKNRNVAVGVISAYQGASVIESWLPHSALQKPEIMIDETKKHEDHYNKYYRLWNENSRLYDLVLSQLFPTALSCVVWYQGESDTSVEEGKVYEKELSLLIDAWRVGFKDENLPFVIVQIADLDTRNDDGWRSVQNAQECAANNINGAYLVISKDICETENIHPSKKKDLAIRIANTLANVV